MLSRTVVRGIEVHIPDSVRSVEEILLDWNSDGRVHDHEKLVRRVKAETGIARIATFEPGESMLLRLLPMVTAVLERAEVAPEQVGFLLCGNEALFQDGDVSPIQGLREVVGMSRCVILPMIQPCTAALMGMGLSRTLLGAGREYMLVVAGNRWPQTARRWPGITSRYVDFTVMGDGLAVMLIGIGGPGPEIIDWGGGHHGSPSAEHIGGGERRSFLERRMAVIQGGAEIMRNLASRNGLQMENLGAIVPPNVNRMVFRSLYASELEVRPELFYQRNLADGGHMGDVDLVRNLKDYLADDSREREAAYMLYSIDVEPTHDVNYHAVLMTGGYR